MTPERARITTKRRIEGYLRGDPARALECMRQEASELLFWILHLQKGQKFQVIEGGKDECSSIAIGPCVVRAASDV